MMEQSSYNKSKVVVSCIPLPSWNIILNIAPIVTSVTKALRRLSETFCVLYTPPPYVSSRLIFAYCKWRPLSSGFIPCRQVFLLSFTVLDASLWTVMLDKQLDHDNFWPALDFFFPRWCLYPILLDSLESSLKVLLLIAPLLCFAYAYVRAYYLIPVRSR